MLFIDVLPSDPLKDWKITKRPQKREVMKKITLAAAFTLAAFPALSGNLSDPVVEPMVSIETIEAGTVASDHGILVPIFVLLIIGAAIAN